MATALGRSGGPPKANPPDAAAGAAGVAAPNAGVAVLPPPNENADDTGAGAAALEAPKAEPAENADEEAAPVVDPNANPAAAGATLAGAGIAPKAPTVTPVGAGAAPNVDPVCCIFEYQPRKLHPEHGESATEQTRKPARQGKQ